MSGLFSQPLLGAPGVMKLSVVSPGHEAFARCRPVAAATSSGEPTTLVASK